MRAYLLTAVSAILLGGPPLTGAGWAAPADPLGLVRVDENGNGSIQLSDGAVPLIALPGFGGGVTYLVSRGPTPFSPGTVLLTESPGGAISDILQFDVLSEDPSGVFDLLLTVYSDSSDLDPAPSLADVATFPPIVGPNPVLTLAEIALSGGDFGISYIPGAGDPGSGFSADGTTLSYRFVSDMPEPAGLGLLGLGLVGLGWLRRRSDRPA